MKISRRRIASVVAKRTLKRGISQDYARELAAYLLTERRTDELDSLLRDVQADWAENGFVEVIASSAHPLNAAIKADIVGQAKQHYPEAKEIIVTETADPSLIGGVRLDLPNQQLDLSVKTKLNTFKQRATAGKG